MGAGVRETILFGGPSLFLQTGVGIAIPPHIRVLPPAARGSIRDVVSHFSPAEMVLVDGVLHHALSVGHAELRDALWAGWRIWGLASMGAIRAYEMRHEGMRGYGAVYGRFESEHDFQDDEVTLLHAPAPPFRPVTEPLIHLRGALASWNDKGWLTPDQTATIADEFKSLWYGERFLRRFQSLVLSAAPPLFHAALQKDFQNFDQFRSKLHDVQNFLAAWEAGTLPTHRIR